MLVRVARIYKPSDHHDLHRRSITFSCTMKGRQSLSLALATGVILTRYASSLTFPLQMSSVLRQAASSPRALPVSQRRFLLQGGRHSFLPVLFATRSYVENQNQIKHQGLDEKNENFSLKKASAKKSVAVVGAGGVGGYYGARLWEAGHDVHFHMRGAHLEASRKKGFNVSSISGNILIEPDQLKAYETTEKMAAAVAETSEFDWVIVSLKSTSLDSIPELIFPLLSKETRVLVLMNGLIEDDLIKLLKEKAGETLDPQVPLQCCKALYGGMCFVCSSRIAPGCVQHTYAGQVTVGVASNQSSSKNHDEDENKVALEELWQPMLSTVPLTFEQNLQRGRWLKNMWNLPFNGISVAMGGITVDKIVQDPGLR